MFCKRTIALIYKKQYARSSMLSEPGLISSGSFMQQYRISCLELQLQNFKEQIKVLHTVFSAAAMETRQRLYVSC